MRTLPRIVVVAGVALWLAAGPPVRANPAVQEREARRRAAMVAVDAEVLRDLFASSATYVHSNGLAQSRDDLIAVLTRGDIRYVGFEVESEAFTTYADSATVVGVGVQTISLSASGREFTSRSRYTVVYARVDGAYRLVAYQSTELPSVVMEQKPIQE